MFTNLAGTYILGTSINPMATSPGPERTASKAKASRRDPEETVVV